MTEKQLRVFVACHKPGTIYQDAVFEPIHVGRAVSKYKKEMGDMIGDDTGDNISMKNPMYCELTAQYWAWKNIHNTEYIGFCHYRRYFEYRLINNLPQIFRHHDIILIKNVLSCTVENDLIRYVSWEDVTIFLKILKKNHPEYEALTLKYLFGNILYTYNMMICKKELFDQYAEWIFPLLSECEKYMRLSPYSRGRRALAYLGEYFMPVYMMYHHYRIYTTQNVSSPIERCKNTRFNLKKMFNKYHHLALYSLKHIPNSFEDYYSYAILTGLEADEINVL